MMGAMLNVVSEGHVMSTTMRAFDATEMNRIMAQTQPLSAMAPAAAKGNGRREPVAAGRKRR
jgi:hypothetical protein